MEAGKEKLRNVIMKIAGLSEDDKVLLFTAIANQKDTPMELKTINGQSLVGTGNIDLAEKTHTHTTAQVTGLDTTLAGKAASDHTHTIAQVTGLQDGLDAKQATLVSGTNIKTINGDSVLGSGDLVVPKP